MQNEQSKMENCQLPKLRLEQSPSKEEGCEMERALDRQDSGLDTGPGLWT